MLQKQSLSPQQALQKLKHFCGYQERNHYETVQKLYSLGLYKKDVEILLSQLIEENYLNEERYAIAFAGGRFRMKQWGRIKIKYELQQNKVSSYNITKALKEIEEADYFKTLETLATKKWTSLKGEQYLNRQAKTTSYLLQKGFEQNLISKVINQLKTKQKDGHNF
ncbi:MAG: RecX family transcriptional regulator [Pedobacter sp.]|nr:RecX family transcriptional regulator [Chitinophagaceae bacterium]